MTILGAQAAAGTVVTVTSAVEAEISAEAALPGRGNLLLSLTNTIPFAPTPLSLLGSS